MPHALIKPDVYWAAASVHLVSRDFFVHGFVCVWICEPTLKATNNCSCEVKLYEVINQRVQRSDHYMILAIMYECSHSNQVYHELLPKEKLYNIFIQEVVSMLVILYH